ncbi:MAG TPA: hypothetical protein VK281_14735 [Xanthobacteraceae bacterium]|nr:hypothetical protein [Xanthobacteraceae bacterium]
MGTTAPAIADNAAALKTREDGEQLMAHLQHVMRALHAMLEKEIELVRAGRLSEVARLEPSKAELARIYITDAALVRANWALLKREVPAMLEKVREWHDGFQKLLQVNLAVLATAHAVSEGIIRGVAGELSRKAAPSTYGQSGRPNPPRANQAQPMALSRTL